MRVYLFRMFKVALKCRLHPINFGQRDIRSVVVSTAIPKLWQARSLPYGCKAQCNLLACELYNHQLKRILPQTAMKTQLLPVLTQLLAKTSLVALAGMGFVSCLLPQASLAQTTYDQPLDDFQPQNNNQSWGSENGGSFSPLDMIHRAQQGTLRTSEDFSSEQRENLNSASSDFRRLQLERLRQQNQASPNQGGTTPQPKINQ